MLAGAAKSLWDTTVKEIRSRKVKEKDNTGNTVI